MASHVFVAQKSAARTLGERDSQPAKRCEFAREPEPLPDTKFPPFSFANVSLFAASENRRPRSQFSSRPSRLSWPMQAKLEIGAVDDPLEREADRVADRVMRIPDPAKVESGTAGERMQRKCSACEEEEKKHTERSQCPTCAEDGRKNDEETPEELSRKAPGGAAALDGSIAPAIVHDVLRSPGTPLDKTSRDFFEPRFRRDFGQVRVHHDQQAAESAAAVHSLAYAVGNNLVFSKGRYDPQSTEGKSLLAHELAHVVQQDAVQKKIDANPSEAVPESKDAPLAESNIARSPTAFSRVQRQSDQSGVDPEIAAVLGAASRARKTPEDRTRMMLAGAEMVYRLSKAFFPEVAAKISSVGYDPHVKGARGIVQGKNIDITVGKDFILDVDPDGVIKPTLKLKELFGTVARGGLLSDIRASYGATAGGGAGATTAPTEAERKDYQQALQDHQEQQKRVNELLNEFATVPRQPAKKPDPETRSHADPETLMQNTVEYIRPSKPGAKPPIELNVLTPTHDSGQRRKDKLSYFDLHVAYPQVGGTYSISPPGSGDDAGVIDRESGAEIGEAHPIRTQGTLAPVSSVLLFVQRNEKLTMERLARTLEHEVQHVADQHETVASLNLAGVSTQYETEFRAYWIEADVQEKTCFSLPAGAACQNVQAPSASPFVVSGGGNPSGLPYYGSPTKKPTPATVKGSEIKNPGGCDICGTDVQSKEVKTQFQNERQQRIFEHLISSYPEDKFDCFYLCSPPFRDMVHNMTGLVGQNVINSIRIETLLTAVNQCAPSLAAGDPHLQIVEDAAGKLDEVDKSFLKDATQSKPFWDVLTKRLPSAELQKVSRIIKS